MKPRVPVSLALLGALTFTLPGCGWDLGPTVAARSFVGHATLYNAGTGALVTVRSDEAIFAGPSRPALYTCRGMGPADLATRNWQRYLRFAAEDPDAPEGVRALLAGGGWCLTSYGTTWTSERSIPASWCSERMAPEPLPLCPPVDPLPCNLGLPAPPGTPSLSFDVPALNFGSLQVGAVTGESVVTLTNSGGGLLCLGAPRLVGDAGGDYTVNASDCAPRPGDPLGTSVLSSATRSSCSLRVRFAPNAPGARLARLRVSSSDAARPQADLELAGTGQGGTLALAPDPVCFNVAPVVVPGLGSCYQRTLTVTNSGPGRVTINSAALPAGAMADWSVAGYAPLPPSLRRNMGQALSVTLRTCRADSSATLFTVNSDATNGVLEVVLLPPASGCAP